MHFVAFAALSGSVGIPEPVTTLPGYNVLSGEFSFRHANYKKGNFMFFDFHVEQMTSKDNIDSDAKFTMPGTVPGV